MMNAARVESEADRQERRDPVPPREQQHGDHRPAHRVEHEGRADDVVVPDPVEPQVQVYRRRNQHGYRRKRPHRHHALRSLGGCATAISSMAEASLAKTRAARAWFIARRGYRSSPQRPRTCGPGRLASSPSRAGARPAARRRRVRPSELRSRRGRRRRPRSGPPPSPGGSACTPTSSAPGGQPAPGRTTAREAARAQTVSASGIRSCSPAVSGRPASTVKAKRPPAGSASAIPCTRGPLSAKASNVSQQEDDVERAGRDRRDVGDLEATAQVAVPVAREVDSAGARVHPEVGAAELGGDEPARTRDAAAQVQHRDPGPDPGRHREGPDLPRSHEALLPHELTGRVRRQARPAQRLVEGDALVLLHGSGVWRSGPPSTGSRRPRVARPAAAPGPQDVTPERLGQQGERDAPARRTSVPRRSPGRLPRTVSTMPWTAVTTLRQ